jgi:hypothetical protein
MRLTAALAVLVLAPLSAFASETTPTPTNNPVPAEAGWSLGAGLSSGDLIFPFRSGLSPVFLTSSTFVPVVAASLERRLSTRTWLALGVSGTFARARADVPPGSFGFAKDDARQAYLTAGLRQVLTAPGAPVDVSVLVSAQGGVARADQHLVSGSEVEQKLSAWLAGADLGIAVDRELTGGLSLRVATPLVGVAYEESRTEVEGQPRRSGTDFSVRAILAPRLELRLAF